jgi:hypothetical protein
MVKDGDASTDPGSLEARIKSTGPVLENLYRQLGSVDLVAIVLKKIVVKRPALDL